MKELVERSGRLTEGELLEVAGVMVKVVVIEYHPGKAPTITAVPLRNTARRRTLAVPVRLVCAARQAGGAESERGRGACVAPRPPLSPP